MVQKLAPHNVISCTSKFVRECACTHKKHKSVNHASSCIIHSYDGPYNILLQSRKAKMSFVRDDGLIFIPQTNQYLKKKEKAK